MASYFGGGRSSGYFSGGRDSGLTLNQALSLIEAEKTGKKKSLLGSIWGGSKTGLGFVLRQIMRPSHGMAEGTRRALEGKGFDTSDFFKGFSRGVQLKKRTTFSEVLEQEGILKGHRRLRGVAGFGLDVFTDPTLPLWLGATAVTGGGALATRVAMQAAAQGISKTSIGLATRRVGLEAAEKTLLKSTKDPFKRATANLAERESHMAAKMARGEVPSPKDMVDLSVTQEMARQAAEETTKVFQLKVGLPKIGTIGLTPTKILGQRVAPKLPSLRRTALGEGVVGKLPLAAKTATMLGHTFRHGFLEEEWQKPLLTAAHAGERVFERDFHEAERAFHPFKRKLSDDERFNALAWGEKQHTLVQGKSRQLNETKLAEAVEKKVINQDQSDFIRTWHDYWEGIQYKEHVFGIKYKKPLGDKLYVPHIYKQDGSVITSGKIAEAGFTKARLEDLTLAEIKELKDKGIAGREGWQTDPMLNAATRTRRSAQARVTESLLEQMRSIHGVSATLPDPSKVQKLQQAWLREEANFKQWERYYKPTYRASFIGNRSRKYHGQHRKEIANINKKYKALRATARTEREHKVLLRRQERLLKAADARRDKNLAGVRQELDKISERAHTKAQQIDAKSKRYLAAASRDWRKKNPNIPKGWEKLDRRIGGEQYYFEPSIRDSMARVEKALKDEAELHKIVATYHKYLAKWKIAVTSVNPGYRVRNSISDVWNMYIAGVPAHAIAHYAGQATAIQRRAESAEKKIAQAAVDKTSVKLSKKERESLQLVWEAHGLGVLSGLFQGDIATVGKAIMAGGASRAFIESGKPIAAFARFAQQFNRRWEDRGRLVHYLYRRKSQKMSPADAAAEVKKAHFDYTELTPVEREKFRAVMPFYTWTRKNIPYQLVQMVSRPGKYATFPKMLQEANYAATGDPRTPLTQEATLPGWLRERYAFRIPFFGNETVALPVMGVSDLAKLENPKDFFNMLAPQWRAGYELATGRSMLTGQEIFTGRRRPISGEAAAIAQFLPGANVGQTERVVRGERIAGKGASPWVGYLAGQLPMTNFLVNQRASIAQARRGGKQTGIGYALGLPTYQRDLEAEMVAAQISHGEKMSELVRIMRDENVIPERKMPKESTFQKRLNTLLGGG